MTHDFAALGIQIPEILLPDKQVDLAKWSVVACDQYTAQPEYWEKGPRFGRRCAFKRLT